MKLEKFQEKNPKQKGIIIGSIVLFILITVIVVYRSFALFEEKQEFDVIKGSVPNQNYDLMLSFQVEDENGNRTQSNTIPNDHNYEVSISCNNGASGSWDYETWGPVIYNLTNINTKCMFLFSKPILLIDKMKSIDIVTNGSGIYEVTHDEANITYTNDPTMIQLFKESELRFAGPNPNNYILFNDELWRIIGLLNTPEGKRVKLVRNESIGNYVWDSTRNEINWGIGVNEWSQSKVKQLLNEGPYYHRTSGFCFIDRGNVTQACDFSEKGLSETSKNMIDLITWNTGSNGSVSNTSITTSQFYSFERSKNTGKICSSSSTGCNDTVLRTFTWQGKVGLMHPSDYGYATIGGENSDRNFCLSIPLYQWKEEKECYENNWIYTNQSQWLMNPATNSERATFAFYIYGEDGYVQGVHAGCGPDCSFNTVRPTIYLSKDLKIVRGSGSYDNPFIIASNE